MNPITHLLASWTFAEKTTREARDRNLVAWAGVLPDLDGLGLVWDTGRMLLGMPGSGYYGAYHHSLLHGLPAAVLLPAVLALFARRRLRVALLGFWAVHLHLFLDVVGSRGPGPEDVWPIHYLAPFSDRWEILWLHQWPLDAWPNVAFTLMLLGCVFWGAIHRGTSVVGLLSSGADAKVVEVLRRRWSWVRGKGKRND